MIVPRLALQSLRNRALTASLTVLAIAFSVMLLLGVEKVRTGARQSFADTISGIDLIVGARSGAIQLLLYSVFRIGNATNNVTWKSYEDIAKRPEIDWIVPISIPGAALQELWGLFGTAETALSIVSAMVVATALLGMVTMVLTTLNERRREMAILRSVGARPATILGLLATEAGMLTLAGVVLGTVLLYATLVLLQPFIDRTYGLHLTIDPPTTREWITLGIIVLVGFLAGLLPAMRAYRLSLADGMTVRT